MNSNNGQSQRRPTWLSSALAAAILIASILTAATAHAALLEGDDATHGLASLTIDTDTGLQWLDVNLSQGRTFLDVSGEFGVGGDFAGFRHASGVELVQLYTNAGIPDINTSDPTVANIAPATALMSLVGVTATQAGNPQTFGFLSDMDGPGLRFNGDIDFSTLNGVGGYQATTTEISRGESFVFSTVGHWLVRVPEPSAGCLAIGALLACCRLRNRRFAE